MNTAPPTARPEVVHLTPEVVEQWLDDGDTVLVDVRENVEHAAEHIPGARHHALSRFDPEMIRDRHGAQRVVFYCNSGGRSAKAARAYWCGDGHVFHLAGGIEAWKAGGRRTDRSNAAPRVDLMRQVHMTAGSLVLAGVLLGVLVSPWFLILSGFVGGGLLFAGATGWCGMAMLLARMPWNAVRAEDSCAPCTTTSRSSR